MLSSSQNIDFNQNLCQQCGSCLSVCPTKAISSRLLKNGLHQILIDQNKCVKCQKCVKVCPAGINTAIKDIYEYCKTKTYYIGHAKDESIRKMASSGGIARTFILEGLKQGIFDGVYSLRKTNEYPFAEGTFFSSQNIPQNTDIPNSVYHPILMNANIHKIEKCKKLLVIGTPCQLHEIETLAKNKYDELYKVAIFCKQQKTLQSTKFIAKLAKTKITLDKPFSINYRGDGWPGVCQVNSNKVPYSVASLMPFGRKLWTVPGCNVCGNPFGTTADISLLDPWVLHKPNALGSNTIIVNTNKGSQLLSLFSDIIEKDEMTYEKMLPSLMLSDVEMKNKLIAYYRKEKVSFRTKIICTIDKQQRQLIELFCCTMPRIFPHVFYKILNKFTPNFRKLL